MHYYYTIQKTNKKAPKSIALFANRCIMILNTKYSMEAIVMTINVVGGTLPQKEIDAYIDYIRNKEVQPIDEITITIDGEYVDLNYTLVPVAFERVRRITGYLVGTMDRWNDAKKAEEADRVKHSV